MSAWLATRSLPNAGSRRTAIFVLSPPPGGDQTPPPFLNLLQPTDLRKANARETPLPWTEHLLADTHFSVDAPKLSTALGLPDPTAIHSSVTLDFFINLGPIRRGDSPRIPQLLNGSETDFSVKFGEKS